MYIPMTKKVKIIIIACSIAIPLPLLFLLIRNLIMGGVRLGAIMSDKRVVALLPVDKAFNLGIGFVILLAILPYTIIFYINELYLSKIERDLPLFFRELAESVRAGLPLIKAIEEISLRGGGPLREEMKRVVFRVALGVPFEEALKTFTKKVDVYSTRVMTVILSEAYHSGARVIDVLETAGDVYSMLLSFKMERDTKIAPYVWVIYIALLLFLVISTVLVEIFFKPLTYLARGMPMLKSGLSPEVIDTIFYYTSLIEAIFGGLIVGKMKGGKAGNSLVHISILLTITLIYYSIFVPIISRLLMPPLPT